MKGRLVAVLGISGVGKTTMVSAFTQRHDWTYSVRASTLLKEATAVSDSEALRTVSAEDIRANQNYLVSAFSKIRHDKPDHHIIFDGHSIIDNDRELVTVPLDFFAQLSPDLIIFIQDDPEKIFARRFSDTTRSRPHRSSEEIAEHQKLAKETAFQYGIALHIPYVVISPNDFLTFEQTLLNFLKP